MTMTYNDNDDDHDVCDRREGVLIHQCLKKKKIGEKKSVLVQTFCKLVFCLLKLASEITATTTTKMEGVSLHLTYFLRDTKRKHLFFF